MSLLEERSIRRAREVACQELGAEAVRRLEVEDFPVTVVNDIYGGDHCLFHLAFRDSDGETASCVAFQWRFQQFDFHRFAKDCVEM
jgi:hypothetical protein